MNIEYYLFKKQNYQNIIFYLDNIIEYLNEIKNKNNSIFSKAKEQVNENEELLNEEINLIKDFQEKKKNIEILKNKCIKNLSKICNHNFIEDYIDINNEISNKIRYCLNCETLSNS
jgi:hypothetical protein